MSLLSNFLKDLPNSKYMRTKDAGDSISTERAFEKGREAKLVGKPKSDNPYTNPGQGAEKTVWTKGWEEGEGHVVRDHVGDKQAYKGYTIGEYLDGSFWVEKEGHIILRYAVNIETAKKEIDMLTENN